MKRALVPGAGGEVCFRRGGRSIHAEAQIGAMRAKAFRQRAHRRARIEMPFAGEEKPPVKPPREVRLERRDARFVHPLMARSALGETLDLADVAWRGEDQRALAHDPRHMCVPPADRALPEIRHPGWRALALAERREHATREPRGVAADLRRALDERHLRAAFRERQRDGQADDARAYTTTSLIGAASPLESSPNRH